MKKVAPDFSGSIRRIRRLLGLVVAPFGLLALLPIALLTVMARTGSGKLAGWAALSSIAVMVATIVTVRSPSRDARHVAAIVVPTLALIALVVLLYRRACRTELLPKARACGRTSPIRRRSVGPRSGT